MHGAAHPRHEHEQQAPGQRQVHSLCRWCCLASQDWLSHLSDTAAAPGLNKGFVCSLPEDKRHIAKLGCCQAQCERTLH